MTNLVQYVIVRSDLISKLNWPVGAVIAQCCHATTAVNFQFIDDPNVKEYFADLDNMHKVVLEASDEQCIRSLAATLTEHDLKHKLWIEQPEDMATCLAVKPYPKEAVHKFVKKLKLFK